MGPVLLHDDVVAEYRDFATYAAGDSPCFEAWASAVAEDPEVLAWLTTLQPRERQPNLVLAAARWHGAPAPGPYDGLRRVLLEQEPEVRATVRSRATQTNEVGRLASLVPAMSLVEGPLALVEVGASAGLCLYPDRYDYAWPPLGGLRGSGGPVLTAVASGPLPVPTAHPEVAWRSGVDLHPLDVADADAMAWLENLVWPEQDERRTRLRAAIEVARREPPTLRRGDLVDHLPALLEEAAPHGTPIVDIKGHRTYPTDGSLSLTTVSVTSAGQQLGLFEAFQAWFSPSDAVVPRDAIYQPEQTVQEAEQESADQMVES
ncbi:MAG TPA: DUF2332 family protein, partial [Nocardioides sp.]|nr:DUF2332 family protein [Nocardioides sp.]